jgi:phosphoribosylformylglycinamidine synthase
LSAAIDGIAEACTALDVPVTGGNVSLYNETKGEGIYPTPVIGVVGILEDVGKAVPSGFQREDETILIATAFTYTHFGCEEREFGSSEYAKTVLGEVWGTPPSYEGYDHIALHNLLIALSNESLVTSASDVSDGGLGVAFARGCIQNGIGAQIELPFKDTYEAEHLFRETGALAVLTCSPDRLERVRELASEYGPDVIQVGRTGGPDLRIRLYGKDQIDCSVVELSSAYSGTLESQLGAEVVTA